MIVIDNLNKKLDSFLDKKLSTFNWWQKAFLKNFVLSFVFSIIIFIPLLISFIITPIVINISQILSKNPIISPIWQLILLIIIIFGFILVSIEFVILFPGIILTNSIYSLWGNWINYIIIPLISFLFWGIIGIIIEFLYNKTKNKYTKESITIIIFIILMILGFMILTALLGPY